MKKRVLSLALALVFCLSPVPGVTMTARAAEPGQTPAAADSAVTLYADFGGGFELLSALYFGKDVTEQTVQVDRPITALRVVKGVCYELNLDRLTMDGACPTGYERKLSAADNDLIQVADSMDFPLSGSGELVIAARAPVEVMGENCSFKFPQINRGPIVPGSFFYSYTLGSDPGDFEDGAALAVPDKGFLFASEMCYPDSGHPDAPMDIYVADDGETLYVFFEAFMDNTFDHGKDFAGVHVRCGDAVKTYKVHTTAENEHGRWRFGYTDSSDAYDWEHMCYLVEVPLADLETSDGALELAFEYYGTAGYQGADLLAVGVGSTFLVADAPTTYYWNNMHEYYPDAVVLPAAGETLNADGGDTTEGDWWITNNDGDFTLTLNGATLDAGSEARNRWDSTDRFPPLYTLGNLTIELAEGTTTTITNNADSTDNYGIDAYGQELIIQGAGTLRVSANWKPVCMNNTLTIRDGATVNAAINATHTERSWSDTSYYPAVDVFGLTVDNATLKATSQVTAPDGGDDAVYAVGIEIGSTMHRLTVENNAMVEASASGGNEAGGNCGILWYGEAARMHFSADEVTILEGGDAGSAGEAEALTTQTARYSTGSKPYVKLVTANEIPAYDLWVAGTQVTGANAADLSVIAGVTVTGDGEASFDPETNTLTLKNASISGAAGIENTISVPDSAREFKISFSGMNTITARNSSDYCRAVNALGADLVLSGGEEATLTIRANMSGESPENGGLRVGSLTITGGTVTVECPAENNGPAHNPYGISLNKDAEDVLKVTGGKLISKGWEPLFYGPSAFAAECVDSNTYLRGATNIDGTGLEPYNYTTNSDYSGGSYHSTYRYVEAVPNEAGGINIAFTVTPPKAGERTAIIGNGADVTGGTDQYLIIGDQYAASVDDLNSFNYFEGIFAKRDYYSYALVIPADASTITAITESDVTITGAEFVSAQVNEYGEARVYFKVTVDEDAQVIESIRLNVTLPEDGDAYFAPDVTTEDAGYTISSAAWLDSDGEVPSAFSADEDYALDLLLKPARGYTFGDRVNVSLNGEDPETVEAAQTLAFHAVLVPIVMETAAPVYNYTLDLNGGTQVAEFPLTAPYTVNSLPTAPSVSAVKPPDGKTFDAFEIDGRRYAPAAAYTATGDFTIKLLWKSSGGSGGGGGGGGAPATYPITAQPSENGTIAISPSPAKPGDQVTVTPKPTGGYEVDAVKVTDRSGREIAVTKNDDGTFSFKMPNGSVSVIGSFKAINPNTGSHDCPSKHLKDVDINAWYHEYVDYVVEKGLMQGVADDLFAPNVTTSRAMIVTILHRLEGKPAASGKAPFDDVVAGSWYADAVAWAEENDIVNGYGGGKFGPNDLITREQFAAIMYRYANFKGYDTSKAADLADYADASAISDWALAAMKWANAENLITGRTTTTLVPRGDATRAEAAAILKRFIENVK